MLDLGALLCGARAARCDDCPVGDACRWRGRGPDPARTSAGVSRAQSRFAGSDRQGRGRLVTALRSGPIDTAALAEAAGWPDDAARAHHVAETLVRDGLAVWSDRRLALPS
jgi:A/G-specific adenine glycosylase